MTRGTCGQNLTWTLDDDGTLTISGTGEMDDDYWFRSGVPWASSYKLIKKVVIEVGVTTIGDYAFYACKSLTSVIIPDSVTTIGDWAFSGCTSLTSVIIPDSVTTIEDWTFKGCTSLTSVIIPDSVEMIGDWVFYYCTSLEKIYYKRDTKINLKSLQVGNNVKFIPYDDLPPAANQNSGWQRDANGTFIYYPSNATPAQAEPPAQSEPSFNLTPLPTQASPVDSPPPAEKNCTVYKNTKISRAENTAPPNTKSWSRVDENIAEIRRAAELAAMNIVMTISLSRVDENIAEIRRAAELAAMNIVMTIERDLGFSPEDVSSQNLGYDIKSTSRDGKISRLIEVKGRYIDAETVTVSRNEIDAALNNPDNFILAIVRLDGGKNETFYIRKPFEQPPDRAALSVNFSIQKLVEVSNVPG